MILKKKKNTPHTPIILTDCREGYKTIHHVYGKSNFFFAQMMIARCLGRSETVPIEARSSDHLQHPIWDSLS